MKIQITDNRLTPKMMAPATEGSAGIDLYACIDTPVRLWEDEKVKVSAGIKVAIPQGWIGVIVPRSSTGFEGKWLANVIGVIDSDYRGDVIVAIKNTSNWIEVIAPMDRIAQMLVIPHYEYNNIEVTDTLDETIRGVGSFGSTGK